MPPTIGIAIAVPEPFGSYLQDQREVFGDPMARQIPPHITLLPPTEVDADQLSEVAEHLDKVAEETAPFEVQLRSTGTFRPVSPVVFVQVASGIAACELLELAIRRDGPIHRETEFGYHPHVTVLHHASDADLDTAAAALDNFSARFQVDAFHLYHHGDDEVWRPVRAFALRGKAHGTD